MSCVMRKKERLPETIAFRVSVDTYEQVAHIAEKERRDLSEVERAIFERGLAAYRRDRELFEPQSASNSLLESPDHIEVTVVRPRKRTKVATAKTRS
jgi:hypothetical protein